MCSACLFVIVVVVVVIVVQHVASPGYTVSYKHNRLAALSLDHLA